MVMSSVLGNLLITSPQQKETIMNTLDLRGLTPVPVTPFNRDESVDFDAIGRLGSWLASIDGVEGLVVWATP